MVLFIYGVLMRASVCVTLRSIYATKSLILMLSHFNELVLWNGQDRDSYRTCNALINRYVYRYVNIYVYMYFTPDDLQCTCTLCKQWTQLVKEFLINLWLYVGNISRHIQVDSVLWWNSHSTVLAILGGSSASLELCRLQNVHRECKKLGTYTYESVNSTKFFLISIWCEHSIYSMCPHVTYTCKVTFKHPSLKKTTNLDPAFLFRPSVRWATDQTRDQQLTTNRSFFISVSG